MSRQRKKSDEEPLDPVEEQAQILKNAKYQVESEAYRMIRALDNGDLSEALKHSARMLNELRTSLLTPKNYYDLYMLVFDKLRHLEMYFREENVIRGRRMSELYELVQHSSSIVPRLYLMITVGSVYIQSKEIPAKALLNDLVEMCKGVQHPTRGLFLRSYLSQMTKDKLPDKGSEYEGEGGDVHDAIRYVIQNFKETVNLFSRLKRSGMSSERQKREMERMDLRILIGTNLVRLSQLDGVDVDIYKETVLPNVLHIIAASGDTLAQQYLMECIVQVFPDDYHIVTLDKFLSACLELQNDVDYKAILTSLMDRLANYAKQFPENIPPGLDIIESFTNYIAKIAQKGIDIADVLTIEISLMTLCMQSYPERVDYVSNILANCATSLADSDINQAATRLVKKLLLIPVEFYKNILTVLDFESYADIVGMLDYEDRKYISTEIVRAAIKYGHKLTNSQVVTKLLDMLQVLIKDSEDVPDDYENYMFEEEQNLVARLVHLFENDSTDIQFKIYAKVRKYFDLGGPLRKQYTLPVLVYASMRLAERINKVRQAEEEVELVVKEDKVFHFIIVLLSDLAQQDADMAMKLFLQSAKCADNCKLTDICFELMSQAMGIYEEQDSKVQLDSLALIINTLQSFKSIDEDNYDTLSTKTCRYAPKLLRKPDQCKAVFQCAHLFWPMENNPELRDSSKALECLQRSLKIVNACMSMHQIPLFVDILNAYLYQFDKRNDLVTPEYLNSLIDLINTNISTVEDEGIAMAPADSLFAPVNVFFKSTIRYMRQKKQSDEEHYHDVKI